MAGCQVQADAAGLIDAAPTGRHHRVVDSAARRLPASYGLEPPTPGRDLHRAIVDNCAVLAGCLWLIFASAAVVFLFLTSVQLVAFVGPRESESTWVRWSHVGETFSVAGSMFTGLVLAATVLIFLAQMRELRAQRDELHRTAVVNAGMLHFALLKMSVDDAELASVWPPFEAGLSVERNKRLLYANMIFRNSRLSVSLGSHSPERVEAHLRYLFSSSDMRDYWRASAHARSFLELDTPEFEFAQVADRICSEYDKVVANGEKARKDERRADLRAAEDVSSAVVAGR